MKDGWEIKKLGEVCEINYGTRVVQKIDGGTLFPVYGGGGATFKIDRFNREDCLIIARFAMSSQCVRFVRGKFFLNDSGLTINSIDSALSQTYLDKHIIALNDKIYSLGKGAAQKNLDIKALKLLDIKFPISISEQERIVSELDCINGILEKKREQIKELDALAQSIFYHMFGDPVTNEKGWEVKKLGEVCDSDLGKTLNQSKDTGELYPYLCAINIQWDRVDLSTVKQTKFEISELERYSVRKGDLLICEGGDIGRAAIWNNEEPMLYQNALHRVRFNGDMHPKFCLFYLRHLKDSGILDSRYGKGVTIKHLVKSSLLSIPIPLPPLPLQQSFATKIAAIEKQKELIKRSIAEVETLLASRMQHHFNS